MASPVRHPYHQPLKLTVNLSILAMMCVMFFLTQLDLGDFQISISMVMSIACSIASVLLLRFERFDQVSTYLMLSSLVLSTFGLVIYTGGLHSPLLYSLPILVLLAAIITSYRETVLFSVALAFTAVLALVQSTSISDGQSSQMFVFEIWLMALTGILLITVIDRQHRQQTEVLWAQLDTNAKLQWILRCEERHSEQLVNSLTDNIKSEQSVFSKYHEQVVKADPNHALVKPIQLLRNQMQQLASYVETEQSLLVQSQPTSLVHVYESMVELFDEHPHSKDVQVHLNLNYDATDFISIDLPRLEQVWMNLFRNALESTKVGEIRIDLMKEGNCYRFQFFDTGCGIPISEQDRIFQIFEQGRPRAQTEGLGIGLALSTSLLRQFGSRLYLKSIENRGTVFWFFIDIVSEGVSNDINRCSV